MNTHFAKLAPPIFAAALLVLLPAVAIMDIAHADEQPAAAAAAPPPPAVTVAAPVQKTVTDWQEYTARLEPVARVELRPRVSGEIAQVHFQDGAAVKAGDLLFTVDRRPFDIAVAAARAELARAEARLDLARLEVGRTAPLVKKDFASAATLDSRRAAERDAAAAVEGARAALAQAELELSWTEVRAPAAGRVSDRRVDPGNQVQANASLLTTILAQDRVYAVFDMTEADFRDFGRRAIAAGSSATAGGAEVQLRAVDEAEWNAKGRMDFLDTAIAAGSGTVRGRATVDNADGLLLAGGYARLRLKGPEAPALLVPDAAIAADQAMRMVLTVADDGTVTPKPVTLGPIVDGLRVVQSGLTAQDRVVVDGLHLARPGAKVTPETRHADAAPAAAPGDKRLAAAQ